MLVLKVLQDQLVLKVLLVQEDPRVHKVQLVQQDPLDLQDPQDLQDQLVLKVLQILQMLDLVDLDLHHKVTYSSILLHLFLRDGQDLHGCRFQTHLSLRLEDQHLHLEDISIINLILRELLPSNQVVKLMQ